MIQALAPRMPRGCWVLGLSIVLIGGLPEAVEAQPPKAADAKAEGEAKKKDAGDAAKKADEEAPAAEEEVKPAQVEIVNDPNAANLVANTFSPLPPIALNRGQIQEVDAMAAGGSVDADLIKRYVGHFASDLTNRAHIKAVLEADAAPPGSARALAFGAASQALQRPIDIAKRAGNAGFLTQYTRALLVVMPQLLSNHLLVRIEAMIALAMAGNPEAVDTFIRALNDKDQTVWVKLWAARGITNIVQTPQGLREDMLGPKAIPAAKALVNLLADDTVPWPVQLRALEALGSLRLASDPTAQTKVEMASAALRILANAEARPDVRAQAAWALGMMRISTAVGRYNYPLVAYHIGEVAAELGERVAATFEENPTQADYWTSFLLYQLYPALNGQPPTRETGLLGMPNLGNARASVSQVNDLVKPIAKTAVELKRSPQSGRKKLLEELSSRVGTLRAFLAKNAPADRSLVAGGPAFPMRAELAGAGR